MADDLCCVVLGGPGTTNALELRDAGSGQLKRKIPSARGFQVFCDGLSAGATQLRGDAKKGNVSLNGLKDNELRRVIRTDTGYAGGMAFSGDGRILAIQSSSEDLIGRYLLYDIVEGISPRPLRAILRKRVTATGSLTAASILPK